MVGGNPLSFFSVVPVLVIILGLSQICGRCAIRFGQPKVVGEIIAGILLGPTLFGLIAPEWQPMLFSPQVKPFLDVLGQIGIVLYMFLVGTAVDQPDQEESLVRQAGILGLSGILPVFAAGAVTAYWLYGELSLPQVDRLTFSFFMGIALAITAFPVLARILHDVGLTDTRIGTLTLTAASMNDAVAWWLMALFLSWVNAEGWTEGLYRAGAGLLVAAFVLLVLKPMLRGFGRKVGSSGRMTHTELGVLLLLLFGAAWLTDFIGLHALFGSFLMGMAMPRSKTLNLVLQTKLQDFVVVFLVPVYFTYSGIQANLLGIFDWAILWPSLILLIVAFLSKYASCTLAMRSMGFSWKESSSVGGLMNARGLMELIIANIGLSHGIISGNVYSILVLMAIVTTMLAVPMFNWSTASPKPGFISVRQLNE